MRGLRGLGSVALLSAALAVAPVVADEEPQVTPPVLVERVSDGSGEAAAPALSADGQVVAFWATDGDGVRQIVVHDQLAGTAEAITAGDDHSTDPALSADGRIVVFASRATDIVAGDSGPAYQIYVHDRPTGETALASVAVDGGPADGTSGQPAISADGTHVAFASHATNLVDGDTNGRRDVFVRDFAEQTTTRVSVSSSGAQGDANSHAPALSGAGGLVAFESDATNLVAGDDNGVRDVFVHDLDSGGTQRVSVGPNGEAAAGSFEPSVSADGRSVAFRSLSTDLVPITTHGAGHVYVRELDDATTERVSVSSGGAEAALGSGAPSISPDGRYVAFESSAGNLAPGATSGRQHVYLHDRASGVTDLVSVSTTGNEGDARSFHPVVSADGSRVAFASAAQNLTGDPSADGFQVYARERGPSRGVFGVEVDEDDQGLRVAGLVSFGAAVLSAGETAEGPVQPAELGAKLDRAALLYRADHGDLLLRLELEELPTLDQRAVPPGLVYGLDFTVDGQRYQVRVGRPATAPDQVAALLVRCTSSTCGVAGGDLGLTDLDRGVGETGAEVRVAVPLERVGGDAGSTVTDLSAFAALGEIQAGSLQALGEIGLPGATVPTSSVRLGLNTEALEPVSAGDGGWFAAVVPGPADGQILYAQACLGEDCAPPRAVFVP